MAHVRTENDRLNKLEEKLETSHQEIRDAMKQEVAAMQQTLVNRLNTMFDEIAKQQDEKLAAVVYKLEGRITRSRDTQESLILSMRDEQLKFQSDMRSTLSTLQSSQGKSPVIVHGDEGFGEGSSTAAGKKGVGFDGGGSGTGNGPGQGVGFGYGPTIGSGLGANTEFQQGNNRNSWRYKKLDMPLFDGTNPDGWILRAERFFEFYGLTEEKVEATVVALEGQALLWFQWEHRRRPIDTWEQAKGLLRRHFRSNSTGSLQEQWLAHRQGGNVSDYRLKFIELLAPLDNVSEEMTLGQFLNGLRDDIRAEVRLLGPLTVDHAMELAHMVEEKFKHSKQRGEMKTGLTTFTKPFPYGGSSALTSPRSSATSYTTSPKSFSPRTYSGYAPSSISTASSPKPGGEIRRLSDKELQEKRSKGLCFRCDGKWSVGHKCHRKELSVLLTHEDSSMEEDGGNGEIETEGEIGTEDEIHPEISLNSVVGITSPKTFKVKGQVNGIPVIVMIDPGATHNFIALHAVEKLGVECQPSKSFGVSLGTGDMVESCGEC